MKKFLSIFLTLCLMLTVVAVPLPAMAETTNKWDFDFENYTPNKYIKMSGRVASLEEADGNTVIKFDNNGIPYRTNVIDATATYTKNADGTYTKAEEAVVEAALAVDPNAYSNYYHASAQEAVFKSNKAPYNKVELYNAIDLNLQLETSTTYKITINYKRENLVNALYVCPVTWCKTANQRPNLTAYAEGRITIPVTDTADSAYTTVSTVITTPEAFNTSGTNGKYVGDTLRLVLYTGFVNANNVVYFDNITVEEYIGSVAYNVGDGASVNGKSVDSPYVVNYYGDDTPVFPTVTYSDGKIVDYWTDDNNSGAAVDAPVLNGSYTAVTKEPVEMVTVQFSKGGTIDETLTKTVEKGEKITLPDTEFTDTSWWNHATPNDATKFVGYEGEEIVVDKDTILYTAETYAKDSGAKMYKNWTVVEDATEGLTYLRKTMVDTDTATAWAHGKDTRLCTRLGVVEDGNTYKISVTYKAKTDTPLDFVMVISAVNNPGGTMRSYLEETKKYLTVSEDTNGWTTATFYITADPPAEVTANNNGLDDTKDISDFEGLYLMVNKATGAHNVDISIKETKVVDLGKVVEAKGASVLTEENAEIAGSQAIRYYFDYATNEGGDGTKIMVGGTPYTVIERGFLYTNGDIEHYAAAGVEGTATPPAADPDRYNLTGKYFVNSYANDDYGYTASDFMMWLADAKASANADKLTYKGVSGEALANNWALENGTVTFSTYVTNIPEKSYSAKMMVRGYVIFEADGVQHIVYSETVNRSVKGIKDALEAGNAGNNSEH